MKRYPSRILLWLKIASVATVIVITNSGCAKNQYNLRYEVPVEDAQKWPPLPEPPRFRYVGALIGEQNVYENQENKLFGNKIWDFLKWVVGLQSNNRVNPVILQRPQSGAVDERGRVLVTDVSRHSIMIFDNVNGTLEEWQAAGDITFLSPIGIVIGENNSVYVADADLGYVVHLNEKGETINIFGKDELERPTGLARDALNKYIYVADTHGHVIKKFDDNGMFISELGERGSRPGQFNWPTHLWFADNKLYVTDTMNARVQILTPEGEFIEQFGKRGRYVGDLVRPKGVATDSDGNIYVIESLHDFLLVYNTKGELLLPIGGSGSGIGQFYLPSGIWADKNNRIYIADMFNGRVVILQYLGGKSVTIDDNTDAAPPLVN